MSDFQQFLDENLMKVQVQRMSDRDTVSFKYDIYQEVREMIVGERKKQGLSQKQLAEKTGISQANICNIEKGTSKPTLDTLKKISDALDKRLVIDFEEREEAL